MKINICLKSNNEIVESINFLKMRGLITHGCLPKSWDLVKTIRFMEGKSKKNDRILDVGCGLPSHILLNLRKMGYRQLYGCDRKIITGIRSSLRFLYYNLIYGLKISQQNAESTRYKNEAFNVIISLSVLEHIINIERYFFEVSRLLKYGGYLITATDYWPVSSGPNTINFYNTNTNEARYFIKPQIEHIIHTANKHRLSLIEPIDFDVQERPINFMDKSYTFIFFVMQKL